jgi:hypothetical protein
MLSTRVHGILDYAVGLLLIALPFLLGLDSRTAEAWVLTGAGLVALVYSVLTSYELGLLRLIPMPVHLALDALSGLFVAASPWLFGFADRVYLPHLLMGAFEIGAALMTRRVPRERHSAVV